MFCYVVGVILMILVKSAFILMMKVEKITRRYTALENYVLY
ncbi:8429_t:CDS:2 [Entrophospora sp. SA101]|nr:8429_t:CDS:2 [Entrophospora sp. SA101]